MLAYEVYKVYIYCVHVCARTFMYTYVKRAWRLRASEKLWLSLSRSLCSCINISDSHLPTCSPSLSLRLLPTKQPEPKTENYCSPLYTRSHTHASTRSLVFSWTRASLSLLVSLFLSLSTSPIHSPPSPLAQVREGESDSTAAKTSRYRVHTYVCALTSHRRRVCTLCTLLLVSFAFSHFWFGVVCDLKE